MLRVGLTGGLGSGKSTVAQMFNTRGAYVLAADEIARDLMRPGQPVFAAIVEHFGAEVVRSDGTLDRGRLAQLAFARGRLDELNAIVHPATIAEQGRQTARVFALNPRAIVVVESALIFESKYGEGWRERFDRMILVIAPDRHKIARFIARSGGADPAALEAEARRRLAQMIPDEHKAAECDFVIDNRGTLASLEARTDEVWHQLQRANG